MGHKIVVYNERHMIVNDLMLWAVRHFLLAEAEASGQSDLISFIRSWDWIGNGVWMGMDFDSFFQEEVSRKQRFVELLPAARRRIESFGTVVPMDYLEANINQKLAYFTAVQPVDRLVRPIVEMRELFDVARPPAT
jgi:hypothetical protein